MQSSEALATAKAMIMRHGLRAPAVAAAHCDEMRAAGDAPGLERWQAVRAAINELRQGAELHGAERRH